MHVQAFEFTFESSMKKEKSQYSNCLCHASNALARNMTALMNKELGKLGLTSSYAYLLMSVADEPGITPKQVSHSLELSQSTVTRLVEKMVFRGLLSRKQDGRNIEITLTEEGRSLMPKVYECIEAFNKNFRELIGEEKVEELTNSIYEAAMNTA